MTSNEIAKDGRGEAAAALRVPLVEETLQVDKRVVDGGGFRVTKLVESREEVIDESLRSERVEIERRPVDRVIADGETPAVRQEGNTMVVPVLEERLVTVKQLVLVEEVRITRTQATRRDLQTVTLRREDIDIERLVAEPSSSPRSP